MEHKDYPVDILDENGLVIAQKPRYAVRKGKDILHGVHTLIITPRAELVLSNIPERNDLPNIYQRRLSTTAAAIRRSNETAKQAAERALRRELLIDQAQLSMLGDEMITLEDGRRTHMTAFYLVAEPPTEFSTMDIESLQVMHVPRFVAVMRSNPDHFAPTLRAVWDRWGDRLPLG